MFVCFLYVFCIFCYLYIGRTQWQHFMNIYELFFDVRSGDLFLKTSDILFWGCTQWLLGGNVDFPIFWMYAVAFVFGKRRLSYLLDVRSGVVF